MYKTIGDFEKKVIKLIEEYSEQIPSDSMGSILIYKGTIEMLKHKDNKIACVNPIISAVMLGISLSIPE